MTMKRMMEVTVVMRMMEMMLVVVRMRRRRMVVTAVVVMVTVVSCWSLYSIPGTMLRVIHLLISVYGSYYFYLHKDE